MSKRFRMLMWLSVTLAVIFQVAFLVELHSPQAIDEILWPLFGVSAACFAMFLYSRATLTSIHKWKR
jgi:hypothetical protein